jgi:hypothetical protein
VPHGAHEPFQLGDGRHQNPAAPQLGEQLAHQVHALVDGAGDLAQPARQLPVSGARVPYEPLAEQ